MRVLFLTDWQRRGGAAIAAQRLATALRRHGHQIIFACARVQQPGSDVHQYTDVPLAWQAVHGLTDRLMPALQPHVQRKLMIARIHGIVEQVRPDVVSVHNLHAVNLPATLPAALSMRVPVVWTLHDMWAFTGTCTYSYDCQAFVEGCTEACPLCDRSPRLPAHQVPASYQARQRALTRAGRIAFATPSRWLAHQATRGMLRDHLVKPISNSVDTETFCPIDRGAAQAALHIPHDAPVVLSASVSLDDPRKGTVNLLDALRRVEGNVTWVTLGTGQDLDLPSNVHRHILGNVQDERLLAQAYSAADVHVLPTLADNLPNVLLEAAACGTPSVAFDVGGVSEVVVDGVTGWTVPQGDSQRLAEAINRLITLAPRQAAQMRTSCRRFAQQHFPLDVQARRYSQLFQHVIGSANQRHAA